MHLGQFEKSLEFSDKAIRLSPHDPSLEVFYQQKAAAYFGLKQYDQAIESARRAIAINPNNNVAASQSHRGARLGRSRGGGP